MPDHTTPRASLAARPSLARALVAAMLSLSLGTALLGALAPPALADGATGSVTGTISAKGSGKVPERTALYLEPIVATGTAAAAPSAPPASAMPPRISQKDATFKPDFVIVTAGDTVEFVNDEAADIDHNVYSFAKGNKFDLGVAGRGSVKEVRFESAGRVTVYCSLHKFMEMIVLVVPSRLWVLPDADGSFRIRDVPPGRYVLRTSQASPRWKEAAIEVTVEAGKAVAAAVELSR